jgi:hypothetical protein
VKISIAYWSLEVKIGVRTFIIVLVSIIIGICHWSPNVS